MAVGTHTCIWIGNTHALLIRAALHHWGHLLQVDLVHDAVAGRNHVDVFKRQLGPVNKVEAVVVTTIFHLAVFLESVLLKARMFDGQRVVDDQLSGHDRVDLGRVTAFIGNGITQAS